MKCKYLEEMARILNIKIALFYYAKDKNLSTQG